MVILAECYILGQHFSEVQSAVIPVNEQAGILHRCENYDSGRHTVMNLFATHLGQCHEAQTKCAADPCRFMTPRLAAERYGQKRSHINRRIYTPSCRFQPFDFDFAASPFQVHTGPNELQVLHSSWRCEVFCNDSVMLCQRTDNP